MSQALISLCLPILNQETVELFENNHVFTRGGEEDSGNLFGPSNVLSGLVVNSRKDLCTNHLVMQAAVSASYLDRKVLVIMPSGKWPTPPPGVHGMPSNNLHITKKIKFLHPKSMQEILDFTADNLGSDDVPDTIIMQDLDTIIHGDAKDDFMVSEKHMVVKIMALLTEFLAQKHIVPDEIYDDDNNECNQSLEEAEIVINGKRDENIATKETLENDDRQADDHLTLEKNTIEDANGTLQQEESEIVTNCNMDEKEIDVTVANAQDPDKEGQEEDLLQVDGNITIETITLDDTNESLQQEEEVFIAADNVDDALENEIDNNAETEQTLIENLSSIEVFDDTVPVADLEDPICTRTNSEDKDFMSELLCFGHLPSLLEDLPNQANILSPFFGELWCLNKSEAVSKSSSNQFEMELVGGQNRVTLKYFLAADSYFLKSVEMYFQDEVDND